MSNCILSNFRPETSIKEQKEERKRRTKICLSRVFIFQSRKEEGILKSGGGYCFFATGVEGPEGKGMQGMEDN